MDNVLRNLGPTSNIETCFQPSESIFILFYVSSPPPSLLRVCYRKITDFGEYVRFPPVTGDYINSWISMGQKVTAKIQEKKCKKSRVLGRYKHSKLHHNSFQVKIAHTVAPGVPRREGRFLIVSVSGSLNGCFSP